ncbi:substrate-binding domain-containing protein [Polaromonas sp. A23]|uniref:helix-turn-helix transcriptional regulator n=1 Tax=Polaromonas sp. A23 TaxID=1944133 RepID=UPI0009852F21|nr:substrate-binding domain-containing protein [Polaromonas sp. A23]OOG38781.1 LysR family transcriptional regulator [Polaromonas sp. A23]
MHKVELSYLLSPERSKDTLIRNPLMDVLHAVREQGSIAKAAREMDLSYRHVWGALKKWEQTLERPLIVWDKGQRAQLTEFGEKLLWAERQAQARLAPQIEALRGDIERAFSTAFDDEAHVLTLYASHDAALSALREQAATRRLHLDIRFMGSVDAIAALNAGRCMMAGFHTLAQPGSKSIAAQTYRNLLKPGLHKLIGFAHRQQGLMVAKNNPFNIKGVTDLAQPGLRYVNRAAGTGTRVLLDELLAQAGVAASGINGYDTQEPSHGAVAQAIASGAADAGLGIEAAARDKGLDFVPLVLERYHLVCLKSALPEAPVQALIAELQSHHWSIVLDSLPGYSGASAQSGEVLSLRAMLPWWNYRKAKVGKA